MDWQTAMIAHEPPHDMQEDDFGYAAGWNIGGLATLGTIVAVWLFAI
ncbi:MULTISPECIES: hypothetical protein [unclassified Bradyrhizobium]|nr:MULTISPECIES: hypothetical protein [unclassified Bradyrhizobium]